MYRLEISVVRQSTKRLSISRYKDGEVSYEIYNTNLYGRTVRWLRVMNGQMSILVKTDSL